MTKPWWEVLGIERSAGSALHRLPKSEAIARLQKAFVDQLGVGSIRNVSGRAWAMPDRFDELVDAVHEAWRELGVSR